MAVFNVPARAGDLKKNRFEFKIPGSTEVLSLPFQEFMPAEGEEYIDENVRDPKLSRRQYILGLMAAIDPAVGEKVAAAALDRKQLGDLFDAWLAASAVDPGKSSRSADS
ncbi:hypothetical protein [Nocardia sp. No.11]|uniref:hypothetical protein n=1 Tax=Nocardia sp. No.11 TaxID=3128861 RepID=UPI00319E6D7F